MPSLPPICLTGASGFIGKRLTARLAALGAADVKLLQRQPGDVPHPGWSTQRIDLSQPIPAGAIPPGAFVIHLAAATGSAGPRVMHELNVAATARLLDAARAAGVRHFVFVSSVAAGYRDQRWAPYGQSKAAAERLVIAAGLPYTIVRPTMVFGRGSPNQDALERLATLPIPVLPGRGDVRVQPIHVNDAANALVVIASNSRAVAAPVTLGGPAVLTMRELYAAIRRARRMSSRAPVRLPLAPLRRGLAVLGAATLSKLPVSAGQFVAFANDSVAEPPPAGIDLPAPHVSLDDMLTHRADA